MASWKVGQFLTDPFARSSDATLSAGDLSADCISDEAADVDDVQFLRSPSAPSPANPAPRLWDSADVHTVLRKGCFGNEKHNRTLERPADMAVHPRASWPLDPRRPALDCGEREALKASHRSDDVHYPIKPQPRALDRILATRRISSCRTLLSHTDRRLNEGNGNA